jgi:microcystin-dependent protein
MSESYVGEIRMFAGDFEPQHWAFCDGRLLPIGEHEALFTVLGTTYGGDGQNTYALPDLRGRVPIHHGVGPGLPDFPLGAMGGAEESTLTASQMPAHFHVIGASNSAPEPTPPGGLDLTTGGPYVPGSLASKPSVYGDPGDVVNMNQAAIAANGSSLPHNNMAPYTTISFIISLFGIYPSQN